MREKVQLEKRARRRYLQNIILSTISTAGIIGIALVAPNVLGAMGKLGIIPHKRQSETIEKARERLIRMGLVEHSKDGLKITKKGRIRLFKEGFYQVTNKKNKKWDGRWRVLIFDIPENLRYVRDQIRMSLLNIGFMRLQNSVWIFPYDCEEYISLLKADMEISDDVLYMIVDELENDGHIRKYFGLE
jgi:DNA-binding transcriptional regulator PaaX